MRSKSASSQITGQTKRNKILTGQTPYEVLDHNQQLVVEGEARTLPGQSPLVHSHRMSVDQRRQLDYTLVLHPDLNLGHCRPLQFDGSQSYYTAVVEKFLCKLCSYDIKSKIDVTNI